MALLSLQPVQRICSLRAAGGTLRCTPAWITSLNERLRRSQGLRGRPIEAPFHRGGQHAALHLGVLERCM